jgi:hypothetical protein
MDRWLTRNAPALVLFVALLGAWQLAVSAFEMREYILPSPLVVLRALGGSEIPWAGHLWITTLEIVGAFVLAGVVGVALGIVIAWSPVLAKALVAHRRVARTQRLRHPDPPDPRGAHSRMTYRAGKDRNSASCPPPDRNRSHHSRASSDPRRSWRFTAWSESGAQYENTPRSSSVEDGSRELSRP